METTYCILPSPDVANNNYRAAIRALNIARDEYLMAPPARRDVARTAYLVAITVCDALAIYHNDLDAERAHRLKTEKERLK